MKIKDIKESELRYIVPITECEIIEESEGKPSQVKIGGTCLVPTVSRNNNKYSISNIQENDGKEVKLFIQEHGELQVKNVVGKLNLKMIGESLKYTGNIRNTKAHPDIVEHAINREVDMSIDARASGYSAVKEQNKTVKSWKHVDIRALCGVGVGGLAENSMEYAIAESLQDTDEQGDNLIQEREAIKMEEMEKLKAQLAEKEQLIKEQEDKVADMEKAAEVKAEEEKKEVVEEIKAVNDEAKESELMGKPISELKLMLKYEKQLKENEVKPVEEPEGAGEGKEVDAGTAEEKEIIVNERDDSITMSEKLYKQHRDAISKNL